jgi:hypothetical protein
LRGWVGFYRGVIGDGDETALIRSPRVALAIQTLPVDGADSTGYYTVGRTAVARRWPVYSAGSTTRRPTKFGDGVVALASSAAFAGRIAEAMNRLDPATRARVRRGFGWF